MRLVKALRRRIVGAFDVASLALVVALVAFGHTGCIEGCDDDDGSHDTVAHALSAADCAPTLRLPMSPRIMEVLDDGSVQQGPPCATANCLAGDRGAWGFRDATSTKIEVGAGVGSQRIELPVPVEGAPRSRYAAQPALRGFVIGKNVAVIERASDGERAAELEVVTPEGSHRVPAPALPDGELVHEALRDADGSVVLRAKAARRGARTRTIALQPSTRDAPHADATPIWNASDARVGWLVPARDGAQASIQRNDGGVLRLAMDVFAGATSARAVADHFIVHVARRRFVVAADGAIVVELPPGFEAYAHDGVIYAVESRAPGGFHVVGAHGLEPLLVPRPGHDLAGEPLPAGAAMQRIEVAVDESRALVATRILLATCTLEDRLLLVDLRAKTARTIATGDVMRMHPTFAGDRFRYVEADASYEAR